MPVTDRIRLRDHRRVSSQLDASVPRRAFAGATLEALFVSGDLAALDDATRDRFEAFAADFLDCDCQSNPFCGHPERKFVHYLLDLRASGLGPEAIVDVMGDDYGLTAYPGDVRSFLDDAVRHLEAIEALADVDGHPEQARHARERRDELL